MKALRVPSGRGPSAAAAAAAMCVVGLVTPALCVISATSREGIHQPSREVTPEELPLVKGDCEVECRSLGANTHCRGECITDGPSILVVDPRSRRVLLQASTGLGHNHTRVIFALDPRTWQIRRVGRTFGAGFAQATVSPSGRYLAFLMASHRSGFDGSWSLEILDLESGESVSPSALAGEDLALDRDTLVDVETFSWGATSDVVAFKAEVRAVVASVSPTEESLRKGHLFTIQRDYNVGEKRVVADVRLP